ncbi:MAG: OmpA family protein [Microscillaceae bacterium]
MAQAQSKLEQANAAYDKFHYAEAIPLYEAVLRDEPRNGEAEEKLADSYRRIGNSREAEKWYAKVVQQPKASLESKLYYAQALAMNGNYEEARLWYKAYAREARRDQRGFQFGKAYEDTANFHKDAARYQLQLAPFNSPQADFGPSFYQDGLVFCSSRPPGETRMVPKYKWNDSYFLDLYFVPNGVNGTELFDAHFKSKLHDGPITFYNGERAAVFTRNNYYKGKTQRSQDGVNKLKMYFTEVRDGEWSNITEFPFNDNEYSVGHPAFSIDGLTLYFVSDMPGSLGGTDIFRTNYENGRWTFPENLGPGINTPGNEMFPFLDASNNLYFASDGHPGLGGLDIFLAKNIQGRFGKPQNLGVPINSQRDDFGFIVDIDLGEGYFSSNREGGAGDDDIYRFVTQTCQLYFTVLDQRTGKPVPDAFIQVEEKDSGLEVVFINEDENLYSFRTAFRTSYVLKAYKEGYVEGKIEKTEQELLDCSDENPVMDTLRIYLNPTFPSPEELMARADSIAKAQAQARRLTSSYATIPEWYWQNGIDTTKILAIKSVYYELNQFNVRNEDIGTMQDVLQVLRDNPSYKLIISSHTDSRASYAYNVQLSQRRTNAVFQYFVSRGIDARRIDRAYFGETRLLTPCPDDVPCDENEHLLNRRSEMVIMRE